MLKLILSDGTEIMFHKDMIGSCSLAYEKGLKSMRWDTNPFQSNLFSFFWNCGYNDKREQEKQNEKCD